MSIILRILKEREFEKYGSRAFIPCNIGDIIGRCASDYSLECGKAREGFAQTGSMI